MNTRFLQLGGLTLKIFLIIFAVSLFFFTYNRFLVDHSLKNLESSLENIEEGNLVGVDYILEHATVEAVTSDNLRDMAKLEYVQTALNRKETTEDTEIIISSMVKVRRQKRGVILNFLDRLTAKFNEIKNFILTMGKRKPASYLASTLREATRLFKEKDFVKSKELFSEVARYGYGTSYGRAAEVYLKNIEDRAKIQKIINELLAAVKDIKVPAQLQVTYYRIANMYMSISEYEKAEEYFNKTISTAERTEIAQKAYFGLGFTKKAEGKLDEASNIFNSFLDKFPDSKLALQTRIQLADIFHGQEKYEAAAQEYYRLAKEFKDSPIADVVLFQASCIYRFDLGKLDEANRLLAELFRDYPASDLIEGAKKLFPNIGQLWGEGLMTEKDKLILAIAKSTPILNLLMKLAEQGAVQYAFYMIEGSIKQSLLQFKDKGDMLVIIRSDEYLTNWVRYRLKDFEKQFKHLGLALEDFIIEFPRKGWVGVSMKIGIGKMKWGAFAVGRMYLKEIDEPYRFWEEERTPRKWVVFDIKKAQIGPIVIPNVLTSHLIKKSEATFNKKQIFWQERLRITPYTGVWAGKVKYDRKEQQKRLEEIELLKKVAAGRAMAESE